MKVLLINLPYYRLMRLRHYYFPLGLGYLAAVARDAGHDVTIYDMEKDAGSSHFQTNLLMRNRTGAFPLFSQAIDDDEHYVWGELKNVLRNFKPDLVGLSIWSTVFPAAVKVAGIIKKLDRSICIVAGGSHPTICDDDVAQQPDVDIVIRGEGEAVFAQLLHSIASGRHDLENIKGITYRTKDNLIRRNLSQALIADIDSIAPPAYEAVLDPSLFHSQDWGCLVTARGCAEACTFCCSKEIWGRKVRSRDMRHVFSEMSQLYKDRGVTFFTFFDDTFTLNKDRVAGLCDMVFRDRLSVNWFAHGRVDNMDEGYAKQLRKGGCFAMQFGVESGSQDLLNTMHKRLYLEDMLRVRALFRKHGILFWATFLLGFPGETEQDLNKTFDFLKQLGPDLASINVFVPYPGSSGWTDLLRMGGVVEWKRLSPHSHDVKFNNIDPAVWQSVRKKIEALADSYNMRTLRSWQWTYRFFKPPLIRACRKVLS